MMSLTQNVLAGRLEKSCKGMNLMKAKLCLATNKVFFSSLVHIFKEV